MGGTPTILIVEDQDLMRAALRDYVQSLFPACTTLEVADGASALRSWTDNGPDLILMDIRLPDANGIDLTKLITAATPGVSVIVISYLTDAIYIEQAQAAGAFGYVVKERISTDLPPLIARALDGERPHEIKGS